MTDPQSAPKAEALDSWTWIARARAAARRAVAPAAPPLEPPVAPCAEPAATALDPPPDAAAE